MLHTALQKTLEIIKIIFMKKIRMNYYNAEKISYIAFMVDELDFFEIAWPQKGHGSAQGSFVSISTGVNVCCLTMR